MNRENIEKLLHTALEIVVDKKYEIFKAGGIESKYSGYIDSFGPAIIQAGVLKTLFFYSKDEDKKKIVDLIEVLYLKNTKVQTPATKKFHEVLAKELQGKNQMQKAVIRTRLMEAVIALKLAMKTVKKITPEGAKNGN